MKLKKYLQFPQCSLNEFLALPKKEALLFDFLTQGEEADRTKLTNEIYCQIFPWFDKQTMAGDTLITYRIPIKQFYGKYYRYLEREKQLEILQTIEKFTPHGEQQIFEFEMVDKKGQPYMQLCNNYHLGNFAILPKHNGINPKRAVGPYFDYFDCFIKVLDDFYNQSMIADDQLKKAIFQQKDYFEVFGSFRNFISSNYLQAFIDDSYNQKLVAKNLSGCSSFEEYVAVATKIIGQRGNQLWAALQRAK